MKRILAAEDSPTQAERLRLILESQGFEVTVARDGQEALDRARAGGFDLIVSDVLMPRLSGYELCRAIKAEPAGRATPFILVTTLNDPMDIIEGLECGADNFVVKPYDADYLVHRVRAVLETQRLRSQGKLKLGVDLTFLGKKLSISSDKEQILSLLVATFEDVIRTNRKLQASQGELAAANAKVEMYARQLEERAKTSEEKYHTLMERAIDAVLVCDSEGTILEANWQTEVLLGRPSTEIVGRRARAFVDPSHAGLADPFLNDAGHADGVKGHEVVLTRGDGSSVWTEASVSVVEVGGQKLRLMILRDVSDRKQLEEQFRQSQKMEAVGRLAGGIAHDFNNLLTAILGYAGIVLARLGAKDTTRSKVEEIVKAGERAASLTRQLLAFSRKQVVQRQVLDVNGVVADMKAMLQRLVGEDIDLRVALGQDVRTLADPSQVEQILMNLVVNARDAMPGGGKLTIETARADVDDAYAARAELNAGSFVTLTVTDTGTGMDAETRRHVFEPFFTTKEPGKGTGLGLATVYGIVKQSAGHVALYSEPGHGTTFRVYLPRTEAAATQQTPASTAPAPRGSETVLLVEDEPVLRDLTCELLQDQGYRVLEAASANDALETARRHDGPIHLVLTDVVMPGKGGPALWQELSRLRPEAKVVFMSGYSDEAMLHHDVLPAGAGFLQKPFAAHTLAKKLREVLEMKEGDNG